MGPDVDGGKDRTGRARIRDAAIEKFGTHGFKGSSVRAIAAAAGVSPALVLHHYGSKDQLRRACDEYVAASVRKTKREAMTAGPPPDPFQMLRQAENSQPLLRYAARMLVESSPGVAEFVESIVSDAVEYMEIGVAGGWLVPTNRPYERAVVLTIWQLGSMVLHEHVRRLMEVDLIGDPTAIMRWGIPALEILTHGVFADDRWERALTKAFETGGSDKIAGKGGSE